MLPVFFALLLLCGLCILTQRPCSESYRPASSSAFGIFVLLPVKVRIASRIDVIIAAWCSGRLADAPCHCTLEKHLRSLQSTRRKKVDEIKAATRYDHLRSLLEKYDDTGSPRRGRAVQPAQVRRDHQMGQRGGPGTPLQQLQPQPQQQQGQRQPASGFAAPKTPTESAVNRTPGGVHNGNTCAPGSTMQIRAPPGQAQPRTPAHAEKTYLDRIADKLLGVEGSTEGGGPEQRYALICQVCFNHNGLCPKEDWDEVQYICPRCGTFNSRRPSSRPTSLFWGSPAAVLPGDPASMQSRTSSTSSESSIGAPTHTRGRLSDVGVPGSSGLRPSPPSPLGPFSADRRRHTDVAEGDENAELQDDSGPRNGHAAQRRASSAGLASSSTALKERVQASQRRGYGGSDGTGYGLADEDVRHDGARDSARRDESHSSDMQVD